MPVVIPAACRTPVAPRGGAFASLDLNALAVPVLHRLLDLTQVAAEQIDEVIVSNAMGPGGNPARSVGLAAGLPKRIAGLSIDRQCAGGMDALLLARQMILAGDADVVIAGGVESYSRRPLRLHTFPDGRPPEAYDQAPFTPWPDRDPDMAEAAAALGLRLEIDRAAQDEWAVDSHAKALAHTPNDQEVVPLAGISSDPFARHLTSALCKRAKPITGNITAANAAVAADAAAFCLVTSESFARAHGLSGPQILAGATVGDDPTCPGLAPVAAIQRVMARTGTVPKDLRVAEIMEAYAVQAIACVQGAGLSADIVNPGGGALARGHPIGASGAINVVRLVHELRKTSGTGLAAIAAAGGIGTALLLSA